MNRYTAAAAAIAAALVMAGCGGSGADDPSADRAATTAPAAAPAPAPETTDERETIEQELRRAAAVYGLEEDGAERVASPAAKDALASAVADYLLDGGTLEDAAAIVQAQIEETIGRALPAGTMLEVLRS